MRITNVVGVVAAVLMVSGARPAAAGPPLLCHPYEIGGARSLPWQGEWWPGRTDYDVRDLVADTQALLTPSMPVIVRMETLRRATIYAARDRSVATNLLGTLVDRARMLERDGKPDAMAWLDAAYVSEAFREMADLSRMTTNSPFAGAVKATQGLADGVDGYAFILRSLELRPGDPSLEFAAALIAARETGRNGPSSK